MVRDAGEEREREGAARLQTGERGFRRCGGAGTGRGAGPGGSYEVAGGANTVTLETPNRNRAPDRVRNRIFCTVLRRGRHSLKMERKLSFRTADYERDYEHDYEIPICNCICATEHQAFGRPHCGGREPHRPFPPLIENLIENFASFTCGLPKPYVSQQTFGSLHEHGVYLIFLRNLSA